MGKPKLNLESFEEMIKFEELKEDVTAPAGIAEMDFDIMESFPNHKFKLYSGKQFTDMVDSIQQFGVLMPIILWYTTDNRYIILSGHNRKNCGQAAGLTKAPVIIKENLTIDEATLIVIETNLRQRSFADMSESERAYCLFEHYRAMKSQGRRSDLILEIEMLMNPDNTSVSQTSAEISRSSGSRTELAEQYNLTEDKVAKYIRIGEHFCTGLMVLFDEGHFKLSVANTLSFITDEDIQQSIVECVLNNDHTVDGKKADLLRDYFEKKRLNNETVLMILSGEVNKKPRSNKPKPIQIKATVVSKYFAAGESKKEIEDIIEQALELFFQSREQNAIN